MILRNKKTGAITNNVYMYDGTIFVYAEEDSKGEYTTLAELNEEWEDYKPAEPLIKGEKIRKAVKAWADANNVTEVEYDKAVDTFVALHKPAKIKFNDSLDLNANDWAILTISELCGEGDS